MLSEVFLALGILVLRFLVFGFFVLVFLVSDIYDYWQSCFWVNRQFPIFILKILRVCDEAADDFEMFLELLIIIVFCCFPDLQEAFVLCIYISETLIVQIGIDVIVNINFFLIMLVEENHLVTMGHSVSLQIIGLEIFSMCQLVWKYGEISEDGRNLGFSCLEDDFLQTGIMQCPFVKFSLEKGDSNQCSLFVDMDVFSCMKAFLIPMQLFLLW